jgi:MFS family permease
MPKIAWRPWLVLSSFSVLQALVTVSVYTALGFAMPMMVHDQGWNFTEGGMGFTVVGGFIGGSSYLPAVLIRKFGVRATLLTGTALVAGGLSILGFTRTLPEYFAGAALCGVGYQMMTLIPATYMLGALFKKRSSVLGFYFTVSSALAAAGPVVVVRLLDRSHNDWRALWRVEAVAALIIGTLCALVMGGSAWLEQQAARTDAGLAADRAKPARPSCVYRTLEDWTLKEAVRTPQFYVLLAAYFGHVICLATAGSFAVAHLTERGIDEHLTAYILAIEAVMGMAWRFAAGILGDVINGRYVLIFALASLVAGMVALAVAHDMVGLLVFAVGTGIGFTVTALAVTVLTLDYYGRKHNLEIFSTICLVGAISALGPTFGGMLRDAFGGFGSTFEILAAMNAVVFLAAVFMKPPRRAAAVAAPVALNEVADVA